MTKFLRFLKSESGVTAIEYGLIAALIALAIYAGLSVAGTSMGTMFNSIGSTLNNAAGTLP